MKNIQKNCHAWFSRCAVLFTICALSGFIMMAGCSGDGSGGGSDNNAGINGGVENPPSGDLPPPSGSEDGGAGPDAAGPGPDADITPPTILSVTPANSVIIVEVSPTITVVFSEPVNSDTARAAFSLTGPSGAVDGESGYNDATHTATFTPHSRLTLFANYTIGFSTDLTDVAGNHLAEPYSSIFTVRDGVWEESRNFIDAGGLAAATEPQIDINSQGNAVVVWSRGGDIYSNYYSVVTSNWSDASLVVADLANSPDVAINENGNAVAVWLQASAVGGSRCVNASQRTADRWENTKLIETCTVDSSSPQVSATGNDRAVAAWLHKKDDTSNNEVYSNYLVGNIGAWNRDDAQRISSESMPAVLDPQIAMNESGLAMAVWEQQDEHNLGNIYWNQRSIGTGRWGESIVISGGDSESVNPKLAINHSGNAAAVWDLQRGEFGGGFYSSAYGRFYRDGNWATIEEEGEPEENIFYLGESVPSVAPPPSPSGVDITIDRQNNLVSTYINSGGNVTSRIYNAGTGVWSAPISIGDIGFITHIGSDINDNAIAVWFASRSRVGYNRYFSGRPELLWNEASSGFLDDGTAPTSSPQIAVSENGMAIAVWVQAGRVVTRVFR